MADELLCPRTEAKEAKPYCCPVCGGRGTVPNGFYDVGYPYGSGTSALPETCRSCTGTGVVWRRQ